MAQLPSLLSRETVANPFEYFDVLRTQDPVHWSEEYRSWILVRHEDVVSGLQAPELSSDRIAPVIQRMRSKDRPDFSLIETFEFLDRWLVFRDPPEHTQLRRLVHGAFSPRIIAAMKEKVVAVADDLLDAAELKLSRGEDVDLIAEIAFPLPAIVIAEMLGVPREDRDQFKKWSDDISALVFGGLEDVDRHARAQVGMRELVDYMTALVGERRRLPQEDLTTRLVEAESSGQRLSEPELVAVCVNLLFGGHETTTNLIGNGTLALLNHPEQKNRLAADADLASAVVEEVLRYDGPAKSVVRVAREDWDVQGTAIKKGDRVFLMLAAANNDPNVFTDPRSFDLERTGPVHVGFGQGPHYCLGAALARLEGSVVLPKLFGRFPTLELSHRDLHWHPVILTRGLENLFVRTQSGILQ